MANTFNNLTEMLLSAAAKAGADSADAMAVRGHSLSIDVRSGQLEQAERAEGTDIGLRVLIGHQQASVSASDISSSTITEMATRAVAMAREAPKDPHIGLADTDTHARIWDLEALELCDPSAEPSPEALQNDAQRAEAAALEQERISQVESASAGYSRHQIQLSTSNGFSGSFDRSGRSISCVAIAGTGSEMESDYDVDSRVFQTDLCSATEIGRRAAARSLERLGARKPKTGAYPILFDERIAASLIGHLLAAANGSAIARGGSWLRDSLGQQVLPATLSIIEDPHRPRASGSRPFDGEGLPTARRCIVENGILQGWTLDLATGRKLGMASTGNAARGTGSPPSPSNWNAALTQGDQNRQDLLKDMGTGLLVTSMI
ncbi:MAG: TldD/PmbA family protein, partial [Paracoccaceae bacterium]|nr:TldD/PmbA family protein [Paracoccaceae bacterium]